MKKLEDLEAMKTQIPNSENIDRILGFPTFKNNFDQYIYLLSHSYLTYCDGIEIVSRELVNWDIDAKKSIIETVINEITHLNHEFNPDKLRALI